MASVVAVCISERNGAQKHEVPEIQLTTMALWATPTRAASIVRSAYWHRRA